jgi:hypothetical protein
MPLYGEGAKNKNLALFPKNQGAMLSRIDGSTIILCIPIQLHSGTIPLCFRSPVFHGNSRKLGIADLRFGPRKELVITTGVGAMRQCLGASLFDLDDPSKEIGRLKDPCFRHEMNEKVMYPMSYVFCSIIHNNSLILPMPYRTTSTYGVVDMVELDMN